MEKLIKLFNIYAEKHGISGKAFNGANIDNGTAYIGNGHICAAISNINGLDGLYDDKLIPVSTGIGHIPAHLFKQIVPKNIVFEVNTTSKELNAILDDTQEKIKDANAKHLFENKDIAFASAQITSNLKSNLKPHDFLKIEIIENMLYINEKSTKIKATPKDSTEYFITFFNVEILKLAIKCLKNVKIEFEATKSPIIVTENNYKIIAMCANVGKSNTQYNNGKAYLGEDIKKALSVLNDYDDKAIDEKELFERLNKAYEIKETKIKNKAIDIFNTFKERILVDNQRGFNVENKLVYITNGKVAYKLSSDLPDGFYSADDFNNKYNQKLVTKEMKYTINKEQMKNITPDNNALAFKITVNKHRFLEALNATQIKNKKYNKLTPSNLIEFKAENDMLFINGKQFYVNRVKGYDKPFINVFDITFFKVLENFKDEITIKLFADEAYERFSGDVRIARKPMIITDYENDMILMPINPDIEKNAVKHKLFNGVRYSMETINIYCEANKLTVEEVEKELSKVEIKKSVI